MTTEQFKDKMEEDLRRLYYDHWRNDDDPYPIHTFFDRNFDTLIDRPWIHFYYKKHEPVLSMIFQQIGADFEKEYFEWVKSEFQRHKDEVCSRVHDYMNDIVTPNH